jgi:LysR family transcriptional regulator, regulator of abg operon
VISFGYHTDRGPLLLKLTQLRNLVAIAERGSLRAAARHLGLAQPVVSRSVQELERELGAALFERRARGMVLTPVGVSFARRAHVILSEVRQAQEEVDQLHGGTTGSVTAALSSVPHIALLPRAIRPFRTRYPDVRLQIVEGPYSAVETGLRDGSVDFFVGPPPGYALPPELLLEDLFDNRRAVLCRKGHPFAKARSLRDLKDAEWVMPAFTRRVDEELCEAFAAHGLPPPRIAASTQTALTMVVLLMNSDLLALMPAVWLSFAPISEALIPIPVREHFPAPSVVVIRRSGLPLTPAAEFMLDLLKRGVGRLRSPRA